MAKQNPNGEIPTREEKPEFLLNSAPPEEKKPEIGKPLLDYVKEEPVSEPEDEPQVDIPLMQAHDIKGSDVNQFGDYSEQPTEKDALQPVLNTKLTWHQARAESDSVRYRSTQDYFSYQESLSIFTFLLDEIRSRNPERLGRVAKRRIALSDGQVWVRYKNSYAGRRDTASYRGHYRMMSAKLQDFAGLSEIEKLDLYYALDIKVPKLIRNELIDRYGVEFDSNGVITGCPRMTHWDVVHPDSDREEQEVPKKGGKVKWMRFTEREDGLMWNFMLDHVLKGGKANEIISKYFWIKFKRNHEEKGANWKRVPETYRSRYLKFLAPNLHRMPFDIETKATLYQNLEIVVDPEFRDELIEATGVVINEDGKVTEYKNRPEQLVLQSRHYESVIGITSANRVSILRNPHTDDKDNVPYTPEEEEGIWTFIRAKMTSRKGRAVRIRQKLTGWNFWREFKQTVTTTQRTTKSLSFHFTENMMTNIMNTPFDFVTKLELLFALDIPLDEEDLKIIKKHTNHHLLNRKGAIRYVSGPGFQIGKNKQKPGFNRKRDGDNQRNRNGVESSDSDWSDDDSNEYNTEAATASSSNNFESLLGRDVPSKSETPPDNQLKVKVEEPFEISKVKLEEPDETFEQPIAPSTAQKSIQQKFSNAQQPDPTVKQEDQPAPTPPVKRIVKPMAKLIANSVVKPTPEELANLPENSVKFPYIANKRGRTNGPVESKMFKRRKNVQAEERKPDTSSSQPRNPADIPKYIPISQRVAYEHAKAKERFDAMKVPIQKPMKNIPPPKTTFQPKVTPNTSVLGDVTTRVFKEPSPVAQQPTTSHPAPDTPRNVPYFARKVPPRELKNPREPIDFEEFQRRIESKRTPGPAVNRTNPPYTLPSAKPIPANIPAVSRHYYNEQAKKQAMHNNNKNIVNSEFNKIEEDMKKYITNLTRIASTLSPEEKERAMLRSEEIIRKFRVNGMNALILKPSAYKRTNNSAYE